MSIPTETLHRSMRLEVEARAKSRAQATEDELLEMEFAFASETPVERYFGFEELEVTPKAARLDRVAHGVVPLIANHNSSEIIGRVLAVSFASGVARARVRFSRSDAARDAVRDVVDGIRQGISFGYRVHKMELIESGDGGDRFRVTDWELFEVTLASMPADPTVGIHRSSPDQNIDSLVEKARRAQSGANIMEPVSHQTNESTFEEVRTAERERIAAVETIGREFKVSDALTGRAVASGMSVDEFVAEVRCERSRGGRPLTPPDTDLGVDEKDLRGIGIQKTLLAHVTGRPQDAERELEFFDYAAKRAGRDPRGPGGFFIPHGLLARLASPAHRIETRTVGKTVGGNIGASLVPMEHEAAAFSEALRARIVSGRMGVQIMAGLLGDSSLPIATSDPTASWVLEGTGSGSSDPAFTAGVLTPHTLRGRVDITRRMLLQSLPQADQIIAQALVAQIAIAIEAAIYAGSGVGAEPEGVNSTSGIGAGTYVTTNGTTEYQSFVDLATLVAEADADLASTGFVITPAVRGRLQGTFLDAGSGIRIWESGGDSEMGSIAGYRAGVTNTLPKNLGAGTDEHLILYGDWSQIVVGLWSGVDLMPDQVTLGDSGGLVLRAFQDADVLVRRAVAFSAMQIDPAA